MGYWNSLGTLRSTTASSAKTSPENVTCNITSLSLMLTNYPISIKCKKIKN